MTERNNLIRALLIFALFITLEIVSIVLIKKNSIIQRYQISLFTHNIKSFFWEKNENIIQFFKLKKINEELADDNARLYRLIDEYQNILVRQKEDQLNLSNTYVTDSLFISGEGGSFDFIPVTIIKNSSNKQHNYLTINKGRKDGIEENLGVISDRGVIGITHAVGENYSLILSFLNPDQNISASIKSSNTFGPLSWSGLSVNRAELREIPLHTRFEVGDTIVTSGLSAMYPSNIPIGTIESSKVSDGVFNQMSIILFEDYRSVTNVYVVKHKDKKMMDALEGASLK